MAVFQDTDYFVGTVGKSSTRKAKVSPTQQMIKDRAYQIWEQMGKPQGQDLVIWLKAENGTIGSSR